MLQNVCSVPSDCSRSLFGLSYRPIKIWRALSSASHARTAWFERTNADMCDLRKTTDSGKSAARSLRHSPWDVRDRGSFDFRIRSNALTSRFRHEMHTNSCSAFDFSGTLAHTRAHGPVGLDHPVRFHSLARRPGQIPLVVVAVDRVIRRSSLLIPLALCCLTSFRTAGLLPSPRPLRNPAVLRARELRSSSSSWRSFDAKRPRRLRLVRPRPASTRQLESQPPRLSARIGYVFAGAP